jgi:ABC-type nitrate/sulfonate/bicarbonate transport system substrate-binding protein
MKFNRLLGMVSLSGRGLSAVFFILLLFCGGGAGWANAAGEVITYAMPITVAAIPVYVALDRGFWADEGLSVRPQMFSAGRLALDALLSGNAQVMSVSETPLVHAMLQGHAIYIVATVTRHQETKFIGRRDHGILHADDLRNKTLATLPGTNSDYFMYRLLQATHIETSDVKIVPLQPPDMVSALVRGDIDGYFAWEPHIYYAQQQLGTNGVIIGPDSLYYGRHCVAMNQDFVRKNPEIVIKLLKGLVKAEDYVQVHPEDAKAIVAQYTNTNRAIIDSLWPEYEVRVELGGELLDFLGAEARWIAVQNRSTVALPQLGSFIYTAGLSKVKPNSVAIH